MGWRPKDVYAVTVEEFAAAWDGWAKVHCAPPEDEMTRDELDDLIKYAHDMWGPPE
jgi:hypothetical protein